MQAGTIEWNGLDLSRLGNPSLTIRRTADPPAPAQATRHLVSLRVRLALAGCDPSVNQARLEHLQQSVTVPEGILSCISPGGHRLEWKAAPSSDNLDEALEGETGMVDLEFITTEPFGQSKIDGLVNSTFTPDGGDAITLHAVRDYQETIASERHSPLRNARKLTTTTVTFTARVMQANPADSPGTRLAALLARRDEIAAVNAPAGVLSHGGENRVMRIQQISPQLDEARLALDVSFQLTRTDFPNAGKAESSVNVETRDTEGANERITVVSGTIEAETEELALAKLTSIRELHSTLGRKLTASKATPNRINGADTYVGEDEAEAWGGSLSFSLEFREVPADTDHFNLRITTQENARSGNRYNYSGSIRASNSSAAIAKARELGGEQAHPFLVSSEEVIELATDPDGTTTQFVNVTFSYEYEGPATGLIFAEITSDRNNSLFTDWQTTISGNITAPDSATARALLADIIAATHENEQPIAESEREFELAKEETAVVTRAAMRLEFSKTFAAVHSRAAAKYTDDTSVDYSTMQSTRTISGTLWTDTRVHSEEALDALVAAVLGASPHRLKRSHAIESWAPEGTFDSLPSGRWIQLDFSAEITEALTGTVPHDLIEARCSITRTGSIPKAVIHEIPQSRPIAQTSVCFTTPTVRISATCKARNLATARAWCQGLRTLVSSIGTAGTTRHEISAPVESQSPEYLPFDGVEITVHVFTAEYQFGWSGDIALMDGVWPAGFPTP